MKNLLYPKDNGFREAVNIMAPMEAPVNQSEGY
jgi:hypothetical protein